MRSARSLISFSVLSLIFVALTSASYAQEADNSHIQFNEIRAETLLLQQTGLSPKNTEPYVCDCVKRYAKIGKWGLGWRIETRCHKQCTGAVTFTNLTVERVSNILFMYPDRDSIPVEKVLQKHDIKNCTEAELPYEYTLEVKGVQKVTSVFTQTLTDVENWTQSVNLSRAIGSEKVLVKLGINLGVSHSTSETSTEVKGKNIESKEEFSVSRPLAVTVPAHMIYRIKYSDSRRNADIPVKIDLVLEGDVGEKHVVFDTAVDPSTGEIIGSTGQIIDSDHFSPAGLSGRLSELVRDVERRTVSLDALVTVSGSDREIEYVLLQKPLEEGGELYGEICDWEL